VLSVDDGGLVLEGSRSLWVGGRAEGHTCIVVSSLWREDSGKRETEKEGGRGDGREGGQGPKFGLDLSWGRAYPDSNPASSYPSDLSLDESSDAKLTP